MGNYDEKLERATRDVVSRAMYAEMREGSTTPLGVSIFRWSIWGQTSPFRSLKAWSNDVRIVVSISPAVLSRLFQWPTTTWVVWSVRPTHQLRYPACTLLGKMLVEFTAPTI